MKKITTSLIAFFLCGVIFVQAFPVFATDAGFLQADNDFMQTEESSTDETDEDFIAASSTLEKSHEDEEVDEDAQKVVSESDNNLSPTTVSDTSKDKEEEPTDTEIPQKNDAVLLPRLQEISGQPLVVQRVSNISDKFDITNYLFRKQSSDSVHPISLDVEGVGYGIFESSTAIGSGESGDFQRVEYHGNISSGSLPDVKIIIRNKAQDNLGEFHDVEISLSHIQLSTMQSGTEICIFQFDRGTGELYLCADPVLTGSASINHINGISIQANIKVVGAEGIMPMYFSDLDMPNVISNEGGASTDVYTAFDGSPLPFNESVFLIDGVNSNVYLQANTYLRQDGNLFTATHRTDNGFDASKQSGLYYDGNAGGTTFVWKGSSCTTSILPSFDDFFQIKGEVNDKTLGSIDFSEKGVVESGKDITYKVSCDKAVYIKKITDNDSIVLDNTNQKDISQTSYQGTLKSITTSHTIKAELQEIGSLDDKYYPDIDTIPVAPQSGDRTATILSANTAYKPFYGLTSPTIKGDVGRIECLSPNKLLPNLKRVHSFAKHSVEEDLVWQLLGLAYYYSGDDLDLRHFAVAYIWDTWINMGEPTAWKTGTAGEVMTKNGQDYVVSFVNSLASRPNVKGTIWVEKNGMDEQDLLFADVYVPEYLEIHKRSSESNLSSGYTFTGLQFDIYDTPQCLDSSRRASAMVTETTKDSNGMLLGKVKYWDGEDFTLDKLVFPEGTYYIRERAPEGALAQMWQENTDVVQVTLNHDATTFVDFFNTPVPAKVRLTKRSAKPALTGGDSWYSLGGARYSLFYDSACTILVDEASGVLVTTEDGNSNEISITIGSTYYLKETKASPGFDIDPKVYTVGPFTTGGTYPIDVAPEIPQVGSLIVYKESTDPSISDNNKCYSLKGAVFGLYQRGLYNASNPDENRVDTITVNQTDGTKWFGRSNVDLVPTRLYDLVELTAPKGFLLDKTVHTVEAKANESVKVTVADTPGNDPIRILLTKKNVETGKPVGEATLAGAEYTVKYYDTEIDYSDDPAMHGLKASRTWVFKTDKDGWIDFQDKLLQVSGDTLFTIVRGGVKYNVFPLGICTIQETKAPKGYELNDEIFIANTRLRSGESTSTTNLPTEENSVKEKPTRGNLSFMKLSADTEFVMPHVLFRLTSQSTGESHILVSDEMGRVSTEMLPHDCDTNSNDGYVYDPVTGLGEELPETGVWFGSDVPDNDRGALPYDTYCLEELPCPANFGKELVTVRDIPIRENDKTVDLGEVENQTIRLKTTALEKQTHSHTVPMEDEARITDTVEYENLTAGRVYMLEGRIIDKKTGEVLKDAKGKELITTREFVAKDSKGMESLDFLFDTTLLYGKTMVVYERLYQEIEGEMVLRAIHEDKDDTDQTFYFPTISTEALGEEEGTHHMIPGKDNTIIDTVTFFGLTPGVTYIVQGELRDHFTGEVITIDDMPVTSTISFIPNLPFGSFEVPFTFDGTKLAGRVVTACETIFDGETEIISHTDFTDEAQTVYLPQIQTLAVDKASGTHAMITRLGSTVVDTVYYKGLHGGETYKVQGMIVDKKTGEPVMVRDNTKPMLAPKVPVLASATFTPTDDSGSVDVVFDFPANQLRGKDLVVYEAVIHKEQTVATHKDTDDPSQWVYVHRQGWISVVGPHHMWDRYRLLSEKEYVGTSVDTGDNNHITYWLLLGIFASLCGVILILKRKSRF